MSNTVTPHVSDLKFSDVHKERKEPINSNHPFIAFLIKKSAGVDWMGENRSLSNKCVFAASRHAEAERHQSFLFLFLF